MRIFLLILLLTMALSGCHKKIEHSPASESKDGWIQGRLTIGPLRPGPVRRDEVEPAVPPELYASHKIVLLTQDGGKKVKEADFDPKGNYKLSAAPGIYLVDVQPHDIGFGNFTPQPVTVEPGKTITHDIDIDTGIR